VRGKEIVQQAARTYPLHIDTSASSGRDWVAVAAAAGGAMLCGAGLADPGVAGQGEARPPTRPGAPHPAAGRPVGWDGPRHRKPRQGVRRRPARAPRGRRGGFWRRLLKGA